MEVKLGIRDYFDTLQKEWVVCKIRENTYSLQKDKDYYSKTAEKKRAKIESIATTSKFLSIFENKGYMMSVVEEILPEFGPPKYLYPNEDIKRELCKKDLFSFFKDGVEVDVKSEDNIVLSCKIVEYDFFNSRVKVLTQDNQEVYFHHNNVARKEKIFNL